jgi:hypothetical protein
MAEGGVLEGCKETCTRPYRSPRRLQLYPPPSLGIHCRAPPTSPRRGPGRWAQRLVSIELLLGGTRLMPIFRASACDFVAAGAIDAAILERKLER